MKIANKLVVNVLIMFLIFGLLVFLVMLGLNFYTRHNQSIAVPNVQGLQVEEAAAFLAKADLKYEVIDSVYRKGGTPGAIIDQIPKAASQIKVGRTLFLTVQAVGQQMITVPDLTDYSQRQAVSLLQGLGFSNIQIEEVSSEYKDLVLSVDYNNKPYTKGQKVPIDAFIRIQVGDGLMQAPTDSTASEDQETPEDVTTNTENETY